jgi:MYND finger
MSIPALGVNMIAEVHVELLPYTANRPCSVCKMLTTFTCAECKNVANCSKECRRTDYPMHKSVCQRIIKPYTFVSLSRVFQNKSFRVEDFQKGPDQPLDPPDTEDYEDIQLQWR